MVIQISYVVDFLQLEDLLTISLHYPTNPKTSSVPPSQH
jgi:hypothetical protein